MQLLLRSLVVATNLDRPQFVFFTSLKALVWFRQDVSDDFHGGIFPFYICLIWLKNVLWTSTGFLLLFNVYFCIRVLKRTISFLVAVYRSWDYAESFIQSDVTETPQISTDNTCTKSGALALLFFTAIMWHYLATAALIISMVPSIPPDYSRDLVNHQFSWILFQLCDNPLFLWQFFSMSNHDAGTYGHSS